MLEWLQQRQLFGARFAGCLHVRIFEVARGALVEAIKQLLVRPLEIEHEIKRLAHARVLELFAAGIDEIALCTGGPLVR